MENGTVNLIDTALLKVYLRAGKYHIAVRDADKVKLYVKTESDLKKITNHDI